MSVLIDRYTNRIVHIKYGIFIILTAVLLVGCSKEDTKLVEHERSEGSNQSEKSLVIERNSEIREEGEEETVSDVESFEYLVAGNDHVHSWSEISRTGSGNCAADVSVLKECMLCGLQKMEVATGAGHDYKETTVEATCNSAGYRQFTCTKCGESYSTDYTALLKHVETVAVEQQESCEIDGIVKHYCEICGTVLSYENVKASGHEWLLTSRGIACEAGAVDVFTCSKCKNTKEEALSGSHVWGSWKDISKATCEKEGLRGRTCAVCGEYEKQATNTLEHKEGAWYVDTESTCSSQGLKVRECTVCGKVTSRMVLDKLEHSYGEWVVEKAASCEKKGLRYKQCSSCREKMYEDIKQLEHSYDWVVEREATCSEKGLRVRECKTCGKQTESENIEMTGHSMSSIPITTVGESCESGGYSVYACSNCSYTETLKYPALGHQWEMQDGIDMCVRCGKTKADD